MSTLNTLKNKDPKEVARLLSVVSSSLLPNPGVGEVILQTGMDAEFVREVLSEIRGHLRIRDEDYSIHTQSRIYALLSEEISKAALANANIGSIKSRLGDKGELHPSQYEVGFTDNVDMYEGLGIRRTHIAEAINHPDKLVHLKPKYLLDDDPRLTISIKSVNVKRVEDRFTLFVISQRRGRVQVFGTAFRAYLTDVDLSNSNEPVDVIRAFIDVYGVRFRLGDIVSKLIYKEVTRLKSVPGPTQIFEQMKILDVQKGRRYTPFVGGGYTKMRGDNAEPMGEVLLAFIIDISKYIETLRKHKVHLSPEAEKDFL